MGVEKIGLETDDSAIRGEIRNLEEKKLTSLFIHTKKSAAALRTTAESLCDNFFISLLLGGFRMCFYRIYSLDCVYFYTGFIISARNDPSFLGIVHHEVCTYFMC